MGSQNDTPTSGSAHRKHKKQSIPAILLSLLPNLALVAIVMTAILALTHFPWDTDDPLTNQAQQQLKTYYATAYGQQGNEAETGENAEYVAVAKEAAEELNIKGQVAQFASDYGLLDKKVLDIGAGRGYLQDMVEDYTGLDISASARRFFHKKFVLGSATSMPFRDNEFDGAWSIWVLEHVPNPEAALVEMRRVMKNGSVLMLAPAWSCTRWAAEGYPVRPYADFGVAGKLTKASIPLGLALQAYAAPPVRLLRMSYWSATGRPTKLRYHRLKPNYAKYWMPDSDAVNSLDRYETALWFMSRGDECLNCAHALTTSPATNHPLEIRIRK